MLIRLFAIAFTLLAASAQASEIKVLVNNKPITALDIDQQQRLMRLVNNGQSVSRQQAVDMLIDQHLQMGAAERMRVTISDNQVNERLDGIAAGTPLKTRQAFLNGLQGQLGIYPRTLENFIRTQMAWGEVVRAVGARELQVRESEVDMFLRNKDGADADAQESFTEYRLQQIVVVVPGNASGSQKNALRGQADGVRSRFSSCEDMASQRGNLPNVVIKDLGWKNESGLPPEERDRLRGVDVNKTTGVKTIDVGYEVLAVCEKRATDENIAERMEAQNTLRQEKGGVLADKIMRDLRADALIEYR